MTAQANDESEKDPPAVRRSRWSTDDHRSAENFLNTTYTGLRVELQGPAEQFRFEHRAAMTDRFSINWMRNSATMCLDVESMGELLNVNTVHHGRLRFSAGEYRDAEATEGQMLLGPPRGGFDSTMQGVELSTVMLTRGEVAQYAAAMCGPGFEADDLRFTGVTPVSPDAAGHWRVTVAHIRGDMLSNPAASASPVVLDSCVRLLSAALLFMFPSTALDAITHPRPPGDGHVPARVRREALDYLHSHAEGPIGPTDAAAVAGVPAPVLDDALRAHHNTTAARTLWQTRLDGAHRDLTDLAAARGGSDRSGGADGHDRPDAASVIAEIAARWGFPHPARFRVAYTQATSGTSPEDTLGA